MFLIQVGNPKLTKISPDDSEFDDVGEILEEIFPMQTECAHILWNGIYVPLSYKYDLSVLYYEIIELLEFLLDQSQSEKTIEFPSNTFNAIWKLAISGSDLSIESKWESVSGNMADILNDRSEVDPFVETEFS